jgi:cytochrome c553
MTKLIQSFLCVAALSAVCLFSQQALAADLVAGKTKADAQCAACHGKDGNTPIDPSYPKLSGQHNDYLQQALKQYKNGSRKNAIMGAQAQQLSAKDIANLSAFYASQPSQLGIRK